MKAVIFLLVCMASSLYGQHRLSAVVKDEHSGEPLAGATVSVRGTTLGSSTDTNGRVDIENVPAGRQVVLFSFVGYRGVERVLDFPLRTDESIEVFMMPREEHLEAVTISATRSSRTIENIPTRVEFIAGEELEEKGNMKPGDIRMLLNESTGIQTQQTSATSYNSSIRIQGLDGKYTQILRDGLPLYSGFSGGLSLLQIVPLDLKQVEVIKGASSTLYGGGAIAGLVNLVTKTPEEERELRFMLNATTAAGLDVSGFYAERFEKVGATVFASYNHGSPYDPANIGFSAIPKYNRFTLNPRLFIYPSDNTTINIGLNTMLEDRLGGDMRYIRGAPGIADAFFEGNKTVRLSSQSGIDHWFDDQRKLSVKNTIGYYDRSLTIPDFSFSGEQWSSFSELTYSQFKESTEWIVGANVWTDAFRQNHVTDNPPVDYTHFTAGLFVQNTWEATEKFSLETGLRGDYQNEYGFFVLPRLSALVKFSPAFTARLGGGLGYKTPTVFTEDAERVQFRNVLPVEVAQTKAEKSTGINLDFNFRTELSERVTFSINTLFFYTRIDDPLVLTPIGNDLLEYRQPEGTVDTRGIETNIKLTYDDFKLFVGYTLADVNEHYIGTTTPFPLVARHRLNNVLMYEVEEKWKIGLEGYYFSRQRLNDGATGKPYWICGLMIEKILESFSVFINFENFLDTRQTRFDTIYTGPVSSPIFRDIYAPVDGFVINGGIKVRL